LLRRKNKRRKSKKKSKRKLLSPRRNKRRSNRLLKRKNSPKRNKIKKRNKNLMLKMKSLKRKKSILLTCSLNLPSILMTGRENSATHPTKLPLLMNFGLNSITKDGLSGKSTTLNTKEKVLLAI
jgi:hypothetical protein